MVHRAILVILLISSSNSSCPPTAEDILQYKIGLGAFQQAAATYVRPPEQIFNRSNYKETTIQPFDFVIVGAGAAGSVLASKLSEKPEWSILVLEAGGDETVYSKTPGLSALLFQSDMNWGWTTTPQKNSCQGMIDNSCAVAAGKVLGGGTSINGMIYTRGNALDYDKWASQGNPGWSYKDVLPHYKALEDVVGISQTDDGYHHYGGPFHLEYPQYVANVTYDVIKGANKYGLRTVDYNGKSQIGVSMPQCSTKRGVRESANEAFLERARGRPNLTIKTESYVIKILINPATKAATGVEYIKGVHAKKEVIISAGIINTPKLLMLSGIGPRKDLKKLNIPLIKDLPVGRNYKDQIQFMGLTFLHNDTTVKDPNYDPVADYLVNGKGPLTATTPAIAFLKLAAVKRPPDVEFLFMKTPFPANSIINPVRYKQVIFDKLYTPLQNQTAITVAVVLLHPRSTGTVTLKDNNPLHDPLIDANQLSNNQDAQTMLAGIRKGIELSQSPTLKALGLTLNTIPMPGCENIEFNSDEYWTCAYRQLSIIVFHGTGTARMGPIIDPKAVVDNRLNVHGVKKLRVVDNSVVPVTYSGHTMGLAMVIASRASDLIREEWCDRWFVPLSYLWPIYQFI